MLGPLSILNNGSIANAQYIINQKDSQYAQLNTGNLLINQNHQTVQTTRRRSDELSELTAEHYADLEWPVKRALNYGYKNYASNKQKDEFDLSSLETREQLAKYYFKLFPFTANKSSNDIFNNNFYLDNKDKSYLELNDRNRKLTKKLNSRKLSRKRKTTKQDQSKPELDNKTKFNKLNFLNRQSSIESSSSSSSSSRRSSTDTTENNNTNNLNKSDNKNLINTASVSLPIDEENLNGLSFSSSLELLNKQEDEDTIGEEKDINDDDFSLLDELNEDNNNKLIKNRDNLNLNKLNLNKTKSLDLKNNVLVDRDLNDKQLLNSLLKNSVQIDKQQQHKQNLNKPIDFSPNLLNNNNNSIASLSKSSLSNSSLESPFFKLNNNNTSNHKNNLIIDNNLDLQTHIDNEILDDSEDDDELEQFITTMSIIKKSRNVRHSKPLNRLDEKNKDLKKDDDFSIISSYDNNNEQEQHNKSKKKRREMNYIERSEILPEPAALQSSSLSNQWINSTSPPPFKPSSTTSSDIQSSFPKSSSNSSITNNNSFNNDNDTSIDRPTLNSARSWKTILFLTLKIIAICTVILLAIFGNLLVIISVLRHHKLRITTNYFVVSLACADILVALFAMTFKASLAIQGSWMFGQLVCDLWNSCDVLFSTASIMHLCCISVDRYYAIIKPLDYPMKITNKLVFIMLTVVWISSTIISFIPIFTGIYTTSEVLDYQKQHPDECDFHVNPYYALISSTVSFWIPCIVMLFTYYRIYLEATRQEKALYKSQVIIPQHHHRNKKKQQKAQANIQSSNQTQQNQKQQQPTIPLNVNNNNNNQININNKNNNEELNGQQMEAKNSIPDIETNVITHNGARLSNTSTTTTVTTLSTSTTTTATSGPATTSASSTGAQQTAQTDKDNNDNKDDKETNNKDETNLVRRKSSSITATMPNSQSLELKNSQINLSIQKERPQPPTSIDIQPVNTGPISSAHRNSHGDDTESGQSTPTKRNINKMRREHKAAKTLGIIMGAFFICWLPFFTVYVFLAICGSSCDSFPGVVVDFLFWIGYFNSSLNPIIYAYFNREFREAFRKTIQDVFCCCLFKYECMRNIRYQLAGQQNPNNLDRLNNGVSSNPNYARRNTTASYTGQFSTTSGAALGPSGCGGNQLLSNSNLSMNSSSIKPPISNSTAK